MRWVWRVLAIGIVIAALVWLWTVFFPSPDRVIRKRLSELAKTASMHGNESPLAAAANASKVADFFTSDVSIKLEGPTGLPQEIDGRARLFEIAHAARLMSGTIDVQFFDINVTVGSDKKTAEVTLTLRAKVPAERDQIIQELKLLLNKLEGNWRIQRVETIKTLSQRKPKLMQAALQSG